MDTLRGTHIRPSLFALQRDIALTLLTVALLGLSSVQAQDDTPCGEALARATEDFYAGRFDDAIELLEGCLSEEQFSGEDEERAYMLLGKVYRANNLEDRARETIRELLRQVPNYQPNPNTEPPDFVTFVEEVRRTMPPPEPEPVPEDVVLEPDPEPVDSMLVMQDPVPTDSTEMKEEPVAKIPPPAPIPDEAFPRKRSGLVKWLAIGGGALAATGVAVLLLTGESPPDEPTSLPEPPSFPPGQ